MTPGEKLKAFEALFKKQTGKSVADFPSIEEAIDSLSFRANNDQIMANRLAELGDSDRRCVQMWRQLVPVPRIAKDTGVPPKRVDEAIQGFIARLRAKHFKIFTKGWTLDSTGEPVSPDAPSDVSARLAEARFQQWLLVLGLRHD